MTSPATGRATTPRVAAMKYSRAMVDTDTRAGETSTQEPKTDEQAAWADPDSALMA